MLVVHGGEEGDVRKPDSLKRFTVTTDSRHDLPVEILARMKKAGARNLVVGFESGNDEILKKIRKGVNTGQAKRFMEDCRQVGLRGHGCFVFGLPGESRETSCRTTASRRPTLR